MATDSEQKDCGCAGGTDGGSCCGGAGRGKWIWIVLAIAVVGVVIAKSPKRNACCGATQAPESQVISVTGKVETVTPTAVEQGQALPRLVDLGATKCIPCKMMAPILEAMKTNYVGKLDVQFIDVWEDPKAGEKYGIKMIPTQIFFNAQGKELFRHEGFFAQEDILAKWKELGVELPAMPAEAPKP
jgi:thioredoxin 1